MTGEASDSALIPEYISASISHIAMVLSPTWGVGGVGWGERVEGGSGRVRGEARAELLEGYNMLCVGCKCTT
jgi:hypothetical protein